MRRFRTRRSFTILIVALLLFQLLAQIAVAQPVPVDDRELDVAPATSAFQRTWARTDQPVASGQVNRTWMWGPEAFTDGVWEEYANSPGQQRQVQYFDKSRMEITDPNRSQDNVWFVTNGLLVVEMVTGQMQIGNDEFASRGSAHVNVAGDSDDSSGPTYATFNGLRGSDSRSEGTLITERVNRNGSVTTDPALGNHDVRAVRWVSETNHTVAGPFWQFMNSSGMVYVNGSNTTANLFENPFYATGFPITEAYWANVKVANTYKDVLVQCFERRCLTYTPDNSAGWQVEAGNVGLHYHAWRYGQETGGLPSTAEHLVSQEVSASSGGVVSYGEEISVTIPPGGLTVDAMVTIYKVPFVSDDSMHSLQQGSAGAASLPLPSVLMSQGGSYGLNLESKESGQSAHLTQPTPAKIKFQAPPGKDLQLQRDTFLAVNDAASGVVWPASPESLSLAGGPSGSGFVTFDYKELEELDLGPYPQIGVAAWDWNSLSLATVSHILNADLVRLWQQATDFSCAGIHPGVEIDNSGNQDLIQGCISEYASESSYNIKIYNRRSIPLAVWSSPVGFPALSVVGPGNAITVPIRQSLANPLVVSGAANEESNLAAVLQVALAIQPIPLAADLIDPVDFVNWISIRTTPTEWRPYISDANRFSQAASGGRLVEASTILHSSFLSDVEFWNLLWKDLTQYAQDKHKEKLAKAIVSVSKSLSPLSLAFKALEWVAVGVNFIDAIAVMLGSEGKVILSHEGAAGPTPTAPTNLQVQGISTSAVRLTWNSTAGTDSEFTIAMKQGNSEQWEALAGPFPGNMRQYEVHGLQPGTEYCFTMRTRSGSGVSGLSSMVCGSTLSASGGSCSVAEHGYWDVFPLNVSRGERIEVYGWGTIAYGGWASGQRIDFEIIDSQEGTFYVGHGIVGCVQGSAYLETYFTIPQGVASGNASMIAYHGDAWTWMPFNIRGSNSLPAAPANLGISYDVYAGSAYLEWDDYSWNEEGFDVWGGARGSQYIDVYLGSTGPDGWFFWLTDEDFDRFSCFAVQAYNANGVSGWSNVICWSSYLTRQQIVNPEKTVLTVQRDR